MHIYYSMKKYLMMNQIRKIVLTKDLSQLQLMYIYYYYLIYIYLFFLIDDQTQRMPLSVQRSVRKQNIKFLHNRIHFSPEYFHFMKRLVQSNVQVIVTFFQQQHGEKYH